MQKYIKCYIVKLIGFILLIPAMFLHIFLIIISLGLLKKHVNNLLGFVIKLTYKEPENFR